MSKVQIEVITYKKERLDYFTDLMKKAHKKYNRLFKKFKDAPILSAYHEVMCNAGRESQFHADVVEMLEKGYRDQSEVIDEFATKLKNYPINVRLPLLGLETKEEIEEYVNNLFKQVEDAIDEIAKEMKGGAE